MYNVVFVIRDLQFKECRLSNHTSSTKIAAIVLGGGLKKIEEQGRAWYEPEEQAKARLDMAYTLFVAGKVDYIILTGKHSIATTVDPDVIGPCTEAEVGKQYLLTRARQDNPLDVSRLADCMLYEAQSVDTISNAWFAKKLCLEPMGITSCVLVTSDYHIERARIIFEWILGPQYTLTCVAAPSPLNEEERAFRRHFEKTLTDYVKAQVIGRIAAGDDEAIRQFMETEHRRMFAGILPPTT